MSLKKSLEGLKRSVAQAAATKQEQDRKAAEVKRIEQEANADAERKKQERRWESQYYEELEAAYKIASKTDGSSYVPSYALNDLKRLLDRAGEQTRFDYRWERYSHKYNDLISDKEAKSRESQKVYDQLRHPPRPPNGRDNSQRVLGTVFIVLIIAAFSVVFVIGGISTAIKNMYYNQVCGFANLPECANYKPAKQDPAATQLKPKKSKKPRPPEQLAENEKTEVPQPKDTPPIQPDEDEWTRQQLSNFYRERPQLTWDPTDGEMIADAVSYGKRLKAVVDLQRSRPREKPVIVEDEGKRIRSNPKYTAEDEAIDLGVKRARNRVWYLYNLEELHDSIVRKKFVFSELNIYEKEFLAEMCLYSQIHDAKHKGSPYICGPWGDVRRLEPHVCVSMLVSTIPRKRLPSSYLKTHFEFQGESDFLHRIPKAEGGDACRDTIDD